MEIRVFLNQRRLSALKHLVAVLVGLSLASITVTAHAQEPPALTPEQRKMQAFAKRQYDRGRMSMSRGDPKTARNHYEDAIEALEDAFGDNDERLVEPLIAFADSFAMIWEKPGKQQRKALEQLLEVYDANDRKGLERATVLARIGDWWVTAGKEDKSTNYYRQAWQELADSAGPEQANRQFQRASTLYFVPPVYRAPDIGARASTTTMSFTLAKSGRVTDPRVLESDASSRLQSSLYKALRKRRYRPPVVDGEPIAVPDLTLSFSYPVTGGYPVEGAVSP